MKKILGFIFVIGYYALINLHLYYFVYYFVFKVAFQSYSKPIGMLISIIGFYLLCRNIMSYTFCLIWSPRTVREGKRSRFNFQRKREDDLILSSGKSIHEQDALLVKCLNSDYPSMERELLQQGDPQKFCKVCKLVKPLRSHHCYTCGKCSLRMDHHCIWLNHCVGLDNYRFFIQLIFHTSLSSIFTLYCLYQCSFYPFYVMMIYLISYQFVQKSILNEPRILIVLHIVFAIAFGCYSLFHFWIIYKDVTTLELLEMFGKNKNVQTYNRKRFSTNLYLLFGTPNFFKAMFFPLLDPLPISGFEYEHEYLQRKTKDLKENYDFLNLNKYD